MKVKLFIVVILFSLVVSKVFCIVSGDDLIESARWYIDRPYSDGDPPNKVYSGEYINGYYHYGEYWQQPDSWEGGFDCSGLVSWCAGLRKHYVTREFPDLLNKKEKTLEEAQPGDIILQPGHMLIFVSYDARKEVIRAISASSKKGIVWEWEMTKKLL